MQRRLPPLLLRPWRSLAYSLFHGRRNVIVVVVLSHSGFTSRRARGSAFRSAGYARSALRLASVAAGGGAAGS